MLRRIAFVAAGLCLVATSVAALDPSDPLKISEVHYDPSDSPQSAHEFIELYNAGPDTLYLDGAVITDEGNNDSVEGTFQFPGSRGGTSIPLPPNDVLLLVPDATGSPYSGIDFEFYAGGLDSDDLAVPNLVKTSGLANELTLGNSGDGITISVGDSNGNIIPCWEVVDGVSWEGGGAGETTATSASQCSDPASHPGLISGFNSLQRCPIAVDSDSSAVDFAVSFRSPGSINPCPKPPDIQGVDYTPLTPTFSDVVSIFARVTDPEADIDTVWLYYKDFADASFDSVGMLQSSPDSFVAQLPSFPDQTFVQFYLRAKDSAELSSTFPADAPASLLGLRIGFQSIAQIQSNTIADSCSSSVFVGQNVNLWGLVTNEAQEFDDRYFFMQEGIQEFSGMRVDVEDGSFQPDFGDSIIVAGVISEFQGQTRVIVTPGHHSVEDTGHKPKPRLLSGAGQAAWESHESMLVTLAGPLTILTGYDGEIVMGEFNLEFSVADGNETLWAGNDTFTPDGISPTSPVNPGNTLDNLTGIVSWRPPINGDSQTKLRLEPRRNNDIDYHWTDAFTRPPAPGAALELRGNHPNPFNPRTRIDFVVRVPGEVSLDVFDIRGQWLRQLFTAWVAEPGDHQVIWDGRDQQGRELPSGVYLLKLRGHGMDVTRKMLLVR